MVHNGVSVDIWRYMVPKNATSIVVSETSDSVTYSLRSDNFNYSLSNCSCNLGKLSIKYLLSSLGSRPCPGQVQMTTKSTETQKHSLVWSGPGDSLCNCNTPPTRPHLKPHFKKTSFLGGYSTKSGLPSPLTL